MSFYSYYPSKGTTIFEYVNFAAFPATAPNGTFALDLSTDNLYVFNTGSNMWVLIAGPSFSSLTVGAYDSQTPSANGLVINSDVLYAQSASATVPGMVNTGVQTFAGNKTFTGTIGASNLSGTNTGDVTIGTANGLSLAGQVLSLGLSSTSTTGALSSTDWNTFNGKGTGSVTSVAATVPSFLSISGSPITTSGTLAISYSGTALPVVNGGTGVTSLGTISDAGTDGITVTGGSNAVITNVSLSQHVADTTHNGYLSSTDWNTFNGKGSGTVTSVAQTVPAFLSISGSPVTTSGTLAIGFSGSALPVANGGTGQTSLGNLTDAGTDGIVVTGGAGALITSASLAQHVADTTHNGYLSSTDWNTFNGKGSGTVTSVAMTVPTFLSVSGSPVTTSGTLAVSLSGTALPVANGGTGQTSFATGALSSNGTTLTSGTLSTANGGTGQNSNWNADGVIYASSTTALASTTVGTSGDVLASNGAGVAPTMQTIQGNATILKAPLQTLLTTAGTGTFTCNTSPSPLYLIVRVSGGGGSGAGGGASSPTAPTAGSTGDSSNFTGTGAITCNGGGGGAANNTGAQGGTGGTATVTIANGTSISAVTGGQGGVCQGNSAFALGGAGGSNTLGGNGSGGYNSNPGTSGAANTGGGGGGGSMNSSTGSGGCGGGAGGYAEVLITTPAASYTYKVGATTTGGAAGTNGGAGGSGAAGIISVTQYFQ